MFYSSKTNDPYAIHATIPLGGKVRKKGAICGARMSKQRKETHRASPVRVIKPMNVIERHTDPSDVKMHEPDDLARGKLLLGV